MQYANLFSSQNKNNQFVSLHSYISVNLSEAPLPFDEVWLFTCVKHLLALVATVQGLFTPNCIT